MTRQASNGDHFLFDNMSTTLLNGTKRCVFVVEQLVVLRSGNVEDSKRHVVVVYSQRDDFNGEGKKSRMRSTLYILFFFIALKYKGVKAGVGGGQGEEKENACIGHSLTHSSVLLM